MSPCQCSLNPISEWCLITDTVCRVPPPRPATAAGGSPGGAGAAQAGAGRVSETARHRQGALPRPAPERAAGGTPLYSITPCLKPASKQYSTHVGTIQSAREAGACPGEGLKLSAHRTENENTLQVFVTLMRLPWLTTSLTKITGRSRGRREKTTPMCSQKVLDSVVHDGGHFCLDLELAKINRHHS